MPDQNEGNDPEKPRSMVDGMSRASLTVAYSGPALEAGAMDVRDLAPALLALGKLFQESSRSVYGPKADLAVKVRATERGSFSVELDVHSWYVAARNFLVGDDTNAARALIALVFGGGGLYPLLKWLRGRKPDRTTTLESGAIRIELGGEAKDVNVQVIQILQNDAAQDAAQAVLRPLDAEGVEAFEAREGGTRLERIEKNELPSFMLPAEAEAGEVISESQRQGAFEVVTLSFEERYKWRLSDGDATFTVDIDDEQFFCDLQEQRVSFRKGDLLRVELSTTTRRSPRGLKTENRVTKVIEIISAPRRFPFMD